MAHLERLLQINMATLAAVGALLLGMGERTLATPLVVTAAAVSSLGLADIAGWFRLSRRTANVLMLVAAAISLRELFMWGTELQALGLARYLIFLQVILMFQQKEGRVYWVLIVLSLLQVVMATLFSQGLWFGVLLTVYMLLGFSAMTLLLVLRQSESLRTVAVFPAPPSTEGKTAGPRWPMIGHQVRLTVSAGDGGRFALGKEFTRRLSRMGLQTLALSLVLFFAVPRFGLVDWQGPVLESQPLTGFTDTVTLGETAKITESRSEVMRVRFFQPGEKNPLRVHGNVYLQGVQLTDYARGNWPRNPAKLVGKGPMERDSRLVEEGAEDNVIRVKTSIEGMDRNELFFVTPFIALENNIDITVWMDEKRLMRDPALQRKKFWYVLGTTAIVNGRQMPLCPATRLEAMTLEDARIFPRDELPKLAELAREWLDASGLPENDRIGRARYLEQQLSTSSHFQYSLSKQDRNRSIDPIEDFITLHPQGHCEYFATALALMLRSLGYPSRLIVGYKCDEWDELGGYLQVREMHAHAWVELYLPPDELPAEYLHGKDFWPWSQNGGWLRLDPSPVNAARSEEEAGLLPLLLRIKGWLDSAWSNYVVELDYRRQRDAIYQPIGRVVQNVLRKATDRQKWNAVVDDSIALFRMGQFSIAAEADWIVAVIQSTIAAMLLLSIGWMAWHGMHRFWFRRGWSGPWRTLGPRAEVEFYRRLETILARWGLVRAPSQTQREFAADAGVRLAAETGRPTLAPLPTVVADAFYHIRFGRRPLDNLQAREVEHAVAELAAAEKEIKKRSPSKT